MSSAGLRILHALLSLAVLTAAGFALITLAEHIAPAFEKVV